PVSRAIAYDVGRRRCCEPSADECREPSVVRTDDGRAVRGRALRAKGREQITERYGLHIEGDVGILGGERVAGGLEHRHLVGAPVSQERDLLRSTVTGSGIGGAGTAGEGQSGDDAEACRRENSLLHGFPSCRVLLLGMVDQGPARANFSVPALLNAAARWAPT